MRTLVAALSVCCSPFLMASSCVPIPPGGGGGGGGGGNPFQEIYDQGLTEYVDAPQVQNWTVTNDALYPSVDVHRFPADQPDGRGPVCMRGDEFFVETRVGRETGGDLLIFLEVGGVCLDEICAATPRPQLNMRLMATGDLLGIGGILDNDRFSNNPLRDADMVHIPYCDGSIFTGDVDRVLSDGNAWNGTNDMAYQRGLLNLTAGLEVAKAKFPNPTRIVLAGSSGGSYGSIAATALTRYYYPTQEIVVVADSGTPILRDQETGFVRRALEEFDALRFIPQSCPDCIENGHVTRVLAWAAERDPNLRLGLMSHAQDAVIGGFFMDSTPEVFSNAWVRESASLTTQFPGRMNVFITPGPKHTYLLDVQSVGTVLQQVVLYAFGPFIFKGDDVSATELAGWELGGLQEEGVNEHGDTVSGYDWLEAFLDGPSEAYDVIDTE